VNVTEGCHAANLTSLQEYVNYNIQVRVYTLLGPGLYSTVLVTRTLEDGELLIQETKVISRFTNL